MPAASPAHGCAAVATSAIRAMLSYQVALSFFGISVFLALVPGPDNLFVLMQSAMWGRVSGICVVLGLCTGLVVHTAAVALGLAAVFAASSGAFTFLKLAGATYLCYLAWGAFRSRAHLDSHDRVPQRPAAVLYRRGILMNLTNPKVSLFFLAFLPQFTSPARGPVALQILQLGVLFILAALLVFGCIAFFSGLFGQYVQRSPSARRLLNRCAGVVFLGLAVKLALSGR